MYKIFYHTEHGVICIDWDSYGVSFYLSVLQQFIKHNCNFLIKTVLWNSCY